MTMTHDVAVTTRTVRIARHFTEKLRLFVHGLARRAELRAQMRALADLDDRLLKDIGLTRDEARLQIRRHG